MNDPKKCPRCGRETPANAPEGICPRCLMEINFETAGTAASGTGTGAGRPAPMTVDEVARRFPELEILGLLGVGGMGAVYKARQPQLDRLVALKILEHREGDPGFVERFSREAKTLARLTHPNIVGVHEFGERDGIFFLIMELVDGATLRDLLRDGRLKPEQALAIVPPICEALQFAHDKGVVHRDIKPENILIDKEGRVKVADFGIARLTGLEPVQNLTGEGQVVGTAHYMAPEQVERPAEVDHRADIYALGVVFYEMLTGELPLGQFLHPSKKVEIDVRLDEVVLKALAKEPERRYQQASEVRTGLATAAGPGLEPSAPTEPLPPLKLGGGWMDWTAATLLLLPLVAGLILERDPIVFVTLFLLAAAATSFLAPWFRAKRIQKIHPDREIGTVEMVLPSCRPSKKRALYSEKIHEMENRGWTFLMAEPHLWTNILSLGKCLRLHFLLPVGEKPLVDPSPACPRRPWQLLVVASAFILTGASTVWELARDWSWIFDPYTQIYNYRFNLGVLALPIGIGLLRLRPWWRIAAMAGLGLAMGFVLFFIVNGLIHGLGMLIPGTTRFWTGPNATSIVLAMLGVGLVLLFWMFAVLRRRDVKGLYQKRGFDRPWLEWAIVEIVLLLALLVAGLLRAEDAGWLEGNLRLTNSDFGPVIERVLSPDDINRTFLDLTNGDFVPPGERIDSSARMELEWWEQLDVLSADLMVLVHEGEPRVATPRPTRFFSGVPTEAFDEPRYLNQGQLKFLTGDDIDAPPPGPGEIRAGGPRTDVFTTPRGAAGLFQVMEVSENPPSLRIRYKLLLDSATYSQHPKEVKRWVGDD